MHAVPRLATGCEAEILAEKRNDMILEAVGYRAGMSAVKDLENIIQTVVVKNRV